MKVFIAVISLVGVISQSGLGVSAQTPEQPYYFIKPAAVGSNAQCEEYFTANSPATWAWPVYTTPGESDICIFFPALTKWLLHQGETVDCVGECCRWLPPAANDGTKPTPLPKPELKWFESSEDCSDSGAAELKPFLLEGGKNGEERDLCVNTAEAPEVFTKTAATVVACSRPDDKSCCALLTTEAKAKLPAPKPQ